MSEQPSGDTSETFLDALRPKAVLVEGRALEQAIEYALGASDE